eukprot:3275865-Pyramimonas_sp.AAC.1
MPSARASPSLSQENRGSSGAAMRCAKLFSMEVLAFLMASSRPFYAVVPGVSGGGGYPCGEVLDGVECYVGLLRQPGAQAGTLEANP